MSTATLDLARTVLRTEASAILSLVDRLDDDFVRAVDYAVRVPRPRRRDRHGQVGHHLPQDRGDALEHRHRGVLSSPRRGDPRRPRHAARRRRRGHRVAQRRDRRSDPAARVDPPHRRAADRDYRRSALDAGACGGRVAQLRHRRRGLPAQPGADGEHDGGTGARRRAGHGGARPKGVPRGGFRRAPPWRARSAGG